MAKLVMWRWLTDAPSPWVRIEIERHISPAMGITSGRLCRPRPIQRQSDILISEMSFSHNLQGGNRHRLWSSELWRQSNLFRD